MNLACNASDLPALLTALGAFITVVGGFALQVYVMLRNQSKKIDTNHQENVQAIRDVAASQTGMQKILGP